MAGRRISVLDVREMLRRFRLGQGNRSVARDLGLSRNSVSKYRSWAELEGFLGEAELPAPEMIEERLGAWMMKQPGPVSSLEVHRETIVDLRSKGVEVRALHGRLQEEQGYQGSYSALLRYVRRLEPERPEVFLRIETAPGEEAQVDFGYAGVIPDPNGRPRKAWVFVMTLSFSRHQYAEIVFDQKVETWVALHVRAFEFLRGVPKRMVPDFVPWNKIGLMCPAAKCSLAGACCALTQLEHLGESLAGFEAPRRRKPVSYLRRAS